MNKILPDKNRRVLIIDDNRAIHEDFRKILAPVNDTAEDLYATEAAVFGSTAETVPQTLFIVDSAYQGQEGVLLVQRALEEGRPYAMAFVDVRMPPGWDGVETTRKIWELDPNLQIVLCTAYSDYSWEEMFAALGQRDGLLILKKPFDAVEALQLAHGLAEKWWLHQQSRQKTEELEEMVSQRTAELQRKQLELRLLFNLMPAMIWFKDTENRILRVNQRVAEAAGKTIEEIEGKPSLEIYPQDAARFHADDLEVIQSAVPKLGFVETLRGPEGEERWVQTDKVPYFDEGGKVIGIVVMAQDITERRKADEAMRESEERFSGAFELAPIGVALVSPDGQFLKVNRALCDVVGYSEAELLSRTFQDITYPGDLAADLENMRQLLSEEIRSYQMEKRYIHARGHLVAVLLNVSLVRDGQGQPRYFISQIQDITERKQAEAARDRLATILESTTDLVGIADPSENLLYLNRAGRNLLGVGLEEDVTKTVISEFLPDPANHLALTEGIPAAIRQGTWTGEVVLLSRRGQEIPVSQVILAHKTPSGDLEFISTIMRDITERKRFETQLFQSQKLETVGKLAGGVAHEFNSIMTAIIGQSELMLNDLPAGNPLCKNASEIRLAADRAAILTRQLLAYGRKQILQPEILDLNDVLTGMESTLRHLMGRDVDVLIVPAVDLGSVKADAGQIEQVIMNIVINAKDAMPNGGKLTLETKMVSMEQENVGSYPGLKPGDYVMLSVTDSGTGMSEEVKAHLFEPFFTTKGVGQGTGLGLSTCYGIVQQSGGHISVYSELSRGTLFKIYLPRVEHQKKIPIKRPDTPNLPRGTETILLVEDDPALREMAATLLRRLGYTVLAAANGIEALGLKQQRDTGHIDLLFTDVVMPHMSGKELAERVQSLHPHTRILFTSAYTENAIVHQGVLNQGVVFLPKPFTPSALAHKLREVLDQPVDLKSDTA